MANARIPPNFPAGEKAIIGSVLLDNDSLIKALTVINARDFYNSKNKLIFGIYVDLYRKGIPIDIVTVTAKLKELGKLGEINQSYLPELVDQTPSAANVLHYCEQVRNSSIKRKIIQTCYDTADKCWNGKDINEILSGLGAACLEYPQNQVLPRTLSEISQLGIRDLEEAIHSSTDLPYSLTPLDSKIGGLYPTDLIVLAARPSMGKSAFALDISWNLATQGYPVIFFSLEMSRQSLWHRLVSKRSGIDLWRLRHNKINEDELIRINHLMEEFSDLPLYIDDSPAQDALDVFTKTSAVSAQKKLKPVLIIVDHLGLMKPLEGKNDYEKVSASIKALKEFTKQLDTTMLVLCQLSREIERRALHLRIPILSDLRDSGKIEEDADMVITLMRKHVYTEEVEDLNHAVFAIRKQRNGPIGLVHAHWEPSTASFYHEGKNP